MTESPRKPLVHVLLLQQLFEVIHLKLDSGKCQEGNEVAGVAGDHHHHKEPPEATHEALNITLNITSIFNRESHLFMHLEPLAWL